MKYKSNCINIDVDFALEDFLSQRGVENIDDFLEPSSYCELNPYLLNNIEVGRDLLLKHLENNSKILFVVDSDTDGFTSSAILWMYIKHFYPNANLEYTVHEGKQHGLDDKIDWIVNDCDYNLVICPDSASYDVNEHKMLVDSGIDCLILDHHEQLYDKDGNAVLSNYKNIVVINNQLSPKYTNKQLVGAGVVYKFCEVLDDYFGEKHSFNYIDLVALGEIADVASRTNSETNYLIQTGLQNVKNRGFIALIESQSKLKEKSKYPYANLTAIDIGFYIGPLINAITRVGTLNEKEVMFLAFVDSDAVLKNTGRNAKTKPYETAAEQTARVAGNARNRQNKIKANAIDYLDFKIQKEELYMNNIMLIEVDDDEIVPAELGGLVAASMVSKYNKPCMILRRNSEDVLQGSIRSSDKFEGLPNFKIWFEKAGFGEYAAGHGNACGVGIKAEKVDDFINFSNNSLDSNSFEICYNVDYILDCRSYITYDLGYLFANNQKLYGNGVNEPTFVIKNIPIENAVVMGADNSSVKINFNSIDFVRFKDYDFVDSLMDKTKTVDVYGRFNINEFLGKTSLQFFIDDYEFNKPSTSKYDF